MILTKPGLPSLPLAADSLPCFWLILTSTTLPYLEKSSTRSSLLQLCGRLPTKSCWLSLKQNTIQSCAFCEAFKTKRYLINSQIHQSTYSFLTISISSLLNLSGLGPGWPGDLPWLEPRCARW